MEPAFPPLPELNAVRDDAQSAPEWWNGNFFLALEALLHGFDPCIEGGAAVILTLPFPWSSQRRSQYRALLARPRTHSAPPRPRVKVHLTFRLR